MNLFEKIELFEKLAASLVSEEELNEDIDNTIESNSSNHIERRNLVKNRIYKLNVLARR